MDEMIWCLESGLLKFDNVALSIPPRDGFEYDNPSRGLIEFMPILKLGDMMTMKVVGYHPSNPNQRQLPTVLSSISSFNTDNGHLAALTDGTFLTALRTGAASAVASKLLGHPDSCVLGIIGCGAQAVTQLHALSRVFKFEKVLSYDIDPSASKSFKRELNLLGWKCRQQL
jgi:ornithine cyclodeaminase/alanine dehydrogenase-like protein (mu-crystallin family)